MIKFNYIDESIRDEFASRVDELAYLTGCNRISYNSMYPEQDGWIIAQETLNEFAAAIIKECIEVVEAGKAGVNQVPAEVALDLIAKNINAYFAVKEDESED